MIIGLHTWEPGITSGDTRASSGGAAWLRYVINHYTEAGHRVVWLGRSDSLYAGFDQRAIDNILATQVPVCHVIIMPWRWQMSDIYPDRNALYRDQFKIVELAGKFRRKVIVHDEDHMMTTRDFLFLKDNHVEIYAPEIQPRDGIKTLHYPYPFEGMEIPSHPSGKTWDIAYAGNNYDRFNQTVAFLSTKFGMSPNTNICLAGNWLEPRDGRESAELVVRELPNVQFRGRIRQEEVLPFLSSSYSTIHLCKESYERRGFITLRWAEAAAAGIVAFIPYDFQGLPSLFPGRTDSASSMNYFLGIAKEPDAYRHIFENQYDFVRDIMKFEPWLELLKI